MLKKILNTFRKLKTLQQLKKYGINLDHTVSFSHDFSIKFSQPKCLMVGKNTFLNGFFVTQGEGKLNIGNNCSFRSGTYLGSVVSITIGNNVFGAEGVFITDNNNHPISPASRLEMTQFPMGHPMWKMTHPEVLKKEVIIHDNVWLGRNCMILKGVELGEGSIVAAGSVVTKSFPSNSIIAGNPAKLVKQLYE